MGRLRELVAELGLDHPETYVQSGNLVFTTDLDETGTVRSLETVLHHEFGFEVPVICRSADEIEAVSSAHPFSDLGVDDRLLQVAFLDRSPDQPIESLIEADEYAPDRFRGAGREVYLAYPDGSARSKLGHALLESRLGVSATLRNWRTVSKLARMAVSRRG